MRNHIHIRSAKPEDMPEIARVLGANQAFFYAKKLIEDAVVISAWFGEEPVGALCLSFTQPEERVIVDRLPDAAMLYRLHVKDERRSLGVGTELLNQAEMLVRQRRRPTIAVGVDVTNDHAMRLYRRLGYAEWQFGEIDTVRETYAEDGSVRSLPDRCLIFVKQIR